MIRYFNAFNWFKYYTGNNKLDRKNSRSLLHFSLMWSVFEQKYFTNNHPLNNRNLRAFNELLSRSLEQTNYLKYIHHFNERYFGIKNRGYELFNTLNLNEEDEILVQTTIRNRVPEQHFVPSLLLIACRFRNNFIHGRKDSIKLHLYAKEFNVLNKFLAEFIEKTGDDIRFNKRRLNN